MKPPPSRLKNITSDTPASHSPHTHPFGKLNDLEIPRAATAEQPAQLLPPGKPFRYTTSWATNTFPTGFPKCRLLPACLCPLSTGSPPPSIFDPPKSGPNPGVIRVLDNSSAPRAMSGDSRQFLDSACPVCIERLNSYDGSECHIEGSFKNHFNLSDSGYIEDAEWETTDELVGADQPSRRSYNPNITTELHDVEGYASSEGGDDGNYLVPEPELFSLAMRDRTDSVTSPDGHGDGLPSTQEADAFWVWDREEEAFKHTDPETGEVIFCPSELD